MILFPFIIFVSLNLQLMNNHRLDLFCFNKPIAIGAYQTAPYICINSNKEIDSLAQLHCKYGASCCNWAHGQYMG